MAHEYGVKIPEVEIPEGMPLTELAARVIAGDDQDLRDVIFPYARRQN
jgi:hypothetical protein